MKKVLLTALTVICIIALVACSTPQTLAQMINVDDLNKTFASDPDIAASGNKLVVSISGNTMTYTLTLNQDIDPSSITQAFKDQFNTTLQSQVGAIVKQYPQMPSCTFAYVILNKSGQQLLQLSQDYKGK